MAYLTGSDGSLRLNNTVVAKVTEWSVSGSVDALRTTTLGQKNESYTPGNTDADGSATVLYYLDGTTSAPQNLVNKVIKTGNTPASTVNLSLRFGSKNIAFDCIITQVNIGCRTGDVMEARISFKVTDGFTTALV